MSSGFDYGRSNWAQVLHRLTDLNSPLPKCWAGSHESLSGFLKPCRPSTAGRQRACDLELCHGAASLATTLENCGFSDWAFGYPGDILVQSFTTRPEFVVIISRPSKPKPKHSVVAPKDPKPLKAKILMLPLNPETP